MSSSASDGSSKRRPSFPARLKPLGRDGSDRSLSGVSASLPASVTSPRGVGLDSQAARKRLIAQLARQGVEDQRVLDAMLKVERHQFVDTALAAQAYEDTSLPIGLGQTISKPSVVAHMLSLLCAGRADRLGRVLEIGTGCGYQAAVLSALCNQVYSMERLRGLHEKARENLRQLRLANLHLLLGDGMAGYPKGAPYAGIIAAAGGIEIPQAWVDQLAIGARLVADRKSTRLNSSHSQQSRMPSSA